MPENPASYRVVRKKSYLFNKAALELSTDSEVGMTIDNGCLIIEPQKRPHYSLEELLAQCDPHAEMSEEDREWIDAPAVGKEIL
ncbi:antitoxin [Klebsiella variicola]|uniref:AbrB/MazE/SpoVT family DNA-binding domain-containing protein n=1 Tax=Klebsiella variicola TaxID=244366 RepID=UPI003F5BD31C